MHHRRVGLTLLVLDVAIHREILVSRLHRCVRRIVGEEHKEGLLNFSPLHPGERFVGKVVGDIVRGKLRNRRTVALQLMTIRL